MVKSTDLVKVLDNGTVQECFEALDEFNKHNEKAREIGWLSLAEKVQVWRTIFQRLKDVNENKVILCQLLNALRILSREKAIMEDVMTIEYVRLLMIRAGIDSEDGPTSHDHLAGMKVIFNMTFQSETMQTMLLSCGLLGCLVKHSHPSQKKIPAENRYFLLKIYFIITALRKTCGATVRKELNGVEVLLDFIDSIGGGAGTYDAMTADLICETLKVLYNVIHDIFPHKVELSAEMFGSDFNLLCRLCVIIKRNLERAVNPPEKKMELSLHSIHPLCAMPVECYKELLKEDSNNVDDFRAIDTIVDCLDVKLDSSDYAPSEPILVALCKLCQNRTIRKYLKKRILPPLKKEDA